MAPWIIALITNIGPLTSVAAGLIKIAEHIVEEIKSDADPSAKAPVVLSDVSSAADDITSALHANTPVAGGP